MANTYDTQPIKIDTDMTVGFREESGILSNQEGIFVTNIIVSEATSGTAPTAGNIVVTDPTSGNNLLTLTVTTAPLVVPFYCPLQWKDFKVTGVTATNTLFQIWYR